jgi:hypothetical protein
MIANAAEDNARGSDFHREPERGHFDLCLHLANGARALKSKLSRCILVNGRLARGLPNHLETHSGGSGIGVERRPLRLVDHWNIPHRERHRLVVGSHLQATRRNRHNPVQSAGRNGRMEIMNLIGGSHRPPKQRQSYVGEDALLGRTRGPIFAAHYPIVGRGAAESNAIALVVRADPSECTAAGHEPFKVENM